MSVTQFKDEQNTIQSLAMVLPVQLSFHFQNYEMPRFIHLFLFGHMVCRDSGKNDFTVELVGG